MSDARTNTAGRAAGWAVRYRRGGVGRWVYAMSADSLLWVGASRAAARAFARGLREAGVTGPVRAVRVWVSEAAPGRAEGA